MGEIFISGAFAGGVSLAACSLRNYLLRQSGTARDCRGKKRG